MCRISAGRCVIITIAPLGPRVNDWTGPAPFIFLYEYEFPVRLAVPFRLYSLLRRLI